jgi:hypothetical protein
MASTAKKYLQHNTDTQFLEILMSSSSACHVTFSETPSRGFTDGLFPPHIKSKQKHKMFENLAGENAIDH